MLRRQRRKKKHKQKRSKTKLACSHNSNESTNKFNEVGFKVSIWPISYSKLNIKSILNSQISISPSNYLNKQNEDMLVDEMANSKSCSLLIKSINQ